MRKPNRSRRIVKKLMQRATRVACLERYAYAVDNGKRYVSVYELRYHGLRLEDYMANLTDVPGIKTILPYIVLRAPEVLSKDQHQTWIKDRCSDLSAAGYTYFRASFPDERPSELYVEGWVERPKEMGPCPWELKLTWEKNNAVNNPDRSADPDASGSSADVGTQPELGIRSERRSGTDPDNPDNRIAPAPGTLVDHRARVLGTDRCLLDGSPVTNPPSHLKKLADGQQTSYVRFSDMKLAGTKPIRPYQIRARHLRCMTLTEMHPKMGMTIARDPTFYKALFCAKCKGHFKIGKEGEFLWDKSDQRVGT